MDRKRIRRFTCWLVAGMLCGVLSGCGKADAGQESAVKQSGEGTEDGAGEMQSGEGTGDGAGETQSGEGTEDGAGEVQSGEGAGDSAGEMQSGEGAGDGAEGVQNGNATASSGSIGTAKQNSGKGSKTLAELFASWDWSSWEGPYSGVTLERVLSDLNESGFFYEGYYNVSGERVDITLEDGTKLLFLEMYPEDAPVSYARYGDADAYGLIMKGEEFNASGFQERYMHQYDVTIDEFFYPNLSEASVTEDELYLLNQTELSILRNQIFAKHGRKFKDAFLNAVYREKNWYQPAVEAAEFDANMQSRLTEVEKQNLQLITAVEESQSFRKKSGADYTMAQAVVDGSWIDLDGDGNKEQLFYEMQPGDSYDNASIAVSSLADGTTVNLNLEGFDLHTNCYVLSMDGRTKLIMVEENGMSADYNMYFYRYEKGEIKCLGSIRSYFECLEVTPDTLSAYVETVNIQCDPVRLEYAIEGDTIVWQEKEYYTYRGNTAEVLLPLAAYTEKGADKPDAVLQEGEEVRILGGDLKKWVQVQRVATGEKLWLKVVDSKCELSGGGEEYSTLCMDGLYFYG